MSLTLKLKINKKRIVLLKYLINNTLIKKKKGKIMAKSNKTKVAAALLCFFLGGFGIHRFYLGYAPLGIAQLVLFIIGWLTLIFGVGLFLLIGVSIWVFVDFILILIGKIKDSKGNELS